MIIVTTDTIPGKNIKSVHGFISATSVQSTNISGDFGASLNNLSGRRIAEYEDMIRKAQANALESLQELARSKGCNAIVGLRYATPNTTQRGTAEIVMYATAVVIE